MLATVVRVHPAVTRLPVYRRLYVSNSVNSFCEPVFFYRCLGSRLSIDGVKSQNEFVTKALTCNKDRFHGTENSNFLGAKINVFHDTENSIFSSERSILSTWALFLGPAGSRSLRARMVGNMRVNDLYVYSVLRRCFWLVISIMFGMNCIGAGLFKYVCIVIGLRVEVVVYYRVVTNLFEWWFRTARRGWICVLFSCIVWYRLFANLDLVCDFWFSDCER